MCGLVPVHARCYGWRHVNVSYQVPCSRLTSLSVSSSLTNSLRDYELDKNMNKSNRNRKLPQVSCIWPNVLLLRRGLAKSQGHVYLENRTNLPGFRTHDSTVCTGQRLQKRWTKRQFSVAAIFSQPILRVPGIKASKMA